MSIDRLGPDDHVRYRDIRLRALKETPMAFSATFENEAQQPESIWRDRLSHSDSAVFIARSALTDVGLVVGRELDGHDRETGLFSMWVAPTARRTGMAGALIEAVIHWTRERGRASVRLHVGDFNASAQNLYRKLGFQATGQTERHAITDTYPDIVELEMIRFV